MSRKATAALNLGPDVVAMLLPHRRPFLFVDRITHYAREPTPTLRAERYVSAADPVFTGHFPELHLWPGVLIQEGLGQSCNLLLSLLGIESWWEERGGRAGEVLEALENLELGYRLHPGFQPQKVEPFLRQMVPPAAFMGLAAAVEIKFLAPVFAGVLLEYEVSRTDVVGEMVRCAIEARAAGAPVARGFMTNKMGLPLPALRTR
jgi:3-hydroxyacyl-[acyl-carrier-protein] dehydratase